MSELPTLRQYYWLHRHDAGRVVSAWRALSDWRYFRAHDRAVRFAELLKRSVGQ
jgi:hypothetical protein